MLVKCLSVPRLHTPPAVFLPSTKIVGVYAIPASSHQSCMALIFSRCCVHFTIQLETWWRRNRNLFSDSVPLSSALAVIFPSPLDAIAIRCTRHETAVVPGGIRRGEDDFQIIVGIRVIDRLQHRMCLGAWPAEWIADFLELYVSLLDFRS